jgi:hypothetical protein
MAGERPDAYRRRIAKLHRAGHSVREIAAATDVPKTTVARDLARLGAGRGSRRVLTPAPPPAPVAAEPVTPAGPPPTDEEIGAWLGEQIRDQRQAAEAARRTDPVLFQRASRGLLAAATLRARMRARDPDDGEVIRVTTSSVEAAAERCRARLRHYVEQAEARRAALPRCPTCGGPVGAGQAPEVSP